MKYRGSRFSLLSEFITFPFSGVSFNNSSAILIADSILFVNSVSLSGSISSMASRSSWLFSPSETVVTSRSGASLSISVFSSQSSCAFKDCSNSENDFSIFYLVDLKFFCFKWYFSCSSSVVHWYFFRCIFWYCWWWVRCRWQVQARQHTFSFSENWGWFLIPFCFYRTTIFFIIWSILSSLSLYPSSSQAFTNSAFIQLGWCWCVGFRPSKGWFLRFRSRWFRGCNPRSEFFSSLNRGLIYLSFIYFPSQHW